MATIVGIVPKNNPDIARSIDRDPKHLKEMLTRAGKHKGTSFIEVYQNCNIFNDGAYALYTEKDTKADNVLVLEHGKPMIFGKENNKGIKLNGLTPEVINIGEGSASVNDVWVHDEFDKGTARAHILSQLADTEGMPTPIGVIRQEEKETYEDSLHNQIKELTKAKGKGDLRKLLFSGNMWDVN